MGMQLVGLVMNNWAPHLNDQCFRVLTRMALTALDEANDKYEACLYFAGREPLISVMNEADKRDPKALEQAILRSIRKLIKLGAIERLNKPCPGRRAEYRLTLKTPPRIEKDQTSRAVNGYHGVKRMGITPRKEWVSPGDQNGYHGVIPQGKQRITEEQEEEIPPELSPPVTLTRETTQEETVNKICGNEDCELGYRYDPSKPKGHRNPPCPECRPHRAEVIPIESRYTKRHVKKT